MDRDNKVRDFIQQVKKVAEHSGVFKDGTIHVSVKELLQLHELTEEVEHDIVARAYYIETAADRLAIAVLNAIDRGSIETRTAISDAFEAYCAVKFDDHNSREYNMMREYRDNLPEDSPVIPKRHS